VFAVKQVLWLYNLFFTMTFGLSVHCFANEIHTSFLPTNSMGGELRMQILNHIQTQFPCVLTGSIQEIHTRVHMELADQGQVDVFYESAFDALLANTEGGVAPISLLIDSGEYSVQNPQVPHQSVSLWKVIPEKASCD
jgi:hypothetical protein